MSEVWRSAAAMSNSKRLWVALPWTLGGLILVVLIAVVWLYAVGKNSIAESLAKVVSAFGVLFAVVVALYGDRMRSQLNPIDLSVEHAHREDNIFNREGEKIVYAHHLRIQNHTPYLPVKNCRVWLVRILDMPRASDSFTFGVGRLMQWAPFEYSPDVRTFSDDQIFDFGVTYVDEGRFRPTFYKEQGGTFHPRGDCGVNESKRYVFEITADNYKGKRQFSVDVSVQKVARSNDWPHEFRAVIKRPS